MNTFLCDTCNAPVYFENIRCLGCGSTLGILPGTYEVHSVYEQAGGTFTDPEGLSYRLCKNSVDHGACNQLVPAGDSSPYCLSCQYTEITPDLGYVVNRELWADMEKAKRRLLYSLVSLGIAPPPKTANSERGLSFRFPVDNSGQTKTGYENGVITITLAEADDAIRETRRQQMGEGYRTLLGHFRHEVGHYYWERLILEGKRHESFREAFGDETQDYSMALTNHYGRNDDGSWRQNYISHYASAHPWEDWAETFAHFLHMWDVLETSRSVGLVRQGSSEDFPTAIQQWLSTTFRLNELGRSIGSGDLYPFVLTTAIVSKMEYVYGVITETAGNGGLK